MTTVDPFGLPPEEALRWFRGKGLTPTFDWRDLWAEQHAKAFTVAKATQLDVLADLHQGVVDAIEQGKSLGQFRKELRPLLQQKGWWGEKEQVDSLTGETKLVQLGSARRLRTIYHTNLTMAHAAGRWERIVRTAEARPWLRYVAITSDGRTRDQHLAWHNTILRWDDPWWPVHYPPNGWGCRCKVMQLSDRDLERYGFSPAEYAPADELVSWYDSRNKVTRQVPRGIDPGFDYNVGEARGPGAPTRSGAPAKPTRQEQRSDEPRKPVLVERARRLANALLNPARQSEVRDTLFLQLNETLPGVVSKRAARNRFLARDPAHDPNLDPAYGYHDWDGTIVIQNVRVQMASKALKALAKSGVWDSSAGAQAVHVLLHEELHGLSRGTASAYRGIGQWIEEAGTELNARRITASLGRLPSGYRSDVDIGRLVGGYDRETDAVTSIVASRLGVSAAEATERTRIAWADANYYAGQETFDSPEAVLDGWLTKLTASQSERDAIRRDMVLAVTAAALEQGTR